MIGKRGSLEISIQAIVIVVLAMTILGLGLVFVQNMFGNITNVGDSTFDKIQDQLQKDLISGNERLVFSQAKINQERGVDQLFGWGVKNDGSTSLEYWAEFSAIKCPNGDCPTDDELNEEWFSFRYNPGGTDIDLLYEVGPAGNEVVRVDLSIPKSATPGLYLLALNIYDVNDANSKYDSTDIFLTVS